MSTLNAASADIEAAAVTVTTAAAAEVPEAVGSSSIVRRHRRRRRRRRTRPSVAASSETTTEGSFRFSDSEEDNRSLHSQLAGSNDEYSFSTETEGISVVSDSRRHSSRRGSCTFSNDEEEEEEVEVDLESGELEMKVHNRDKRRECRICHLRRDNCADHSIIELGCCCKGDLGSAHKQCAETWFKIRGNTTCEICGSSAVNIAGEQPNEAPNGAGSAPAASTAPLVFNENRNFWHGRRVMNFLLACMIFAFIISWLFHFKVLT